MTGSSHLESREQEEERDELELERPERTRLQGHQMPQQEFHGLSHEKEKVQNDSVQFSSVAQSCLTLCDPMGCSTPSLPVHHQLPELILIHVHPVSDAIQPSHPLSSPSPAFNLYQHQGLSQGVSSSHQVAKASELQLQYQSFQ